MGVILRHVCCQMEWSSTEGILLRQGNSRSETSDSQGGRTPKKARVFLEGSEVDSSVDNSEFKLWISNAPTPQCILLQSSLGSNMLSIQGFIWIR